MGSHSYSWNWTTGVYDLFTLCIINLITVVDKPGMSIVNKKTYVYLSAFLLAYSYQTSSYDN